MSADLRKTERPKISYAQHAEDIVLDRAFADLEEGFYIDVGANDPDQDSVTKLFYERGWHGINIEPSSQYHHKLQSCRVRDINLSCLAGEKDGDIIFYEIEDTGLSTVRPDLRLAHETKGYGGAEKRMPVRSLRSILQEFAPATVHFLKVDVEGYELEVLRGADWQSFRPWVVVVETTVPLEGGAPSPEIEGFLRDRGYKRCLFDGLNSFFVASEHPELERFFASPANPFDRFQTAGYSHLQGLVEAMAAERIAMIEQRDAMIAQWNARFAAMETEKQELERSSQVAWEKHTRKLADARESLSNMQRSLSWKLTAPLRIVHGLVFHREATFKMLKQHLRSAES